MGVIGSSRDRSHRLTFHPCDGPITQPKQFSHLLAASPSGIQLHSSQKINLMVFFVVRITVRNETNLFIFKHFHQILQRFPQTVEIFFGPDPRVGFAPEAGFPVGQQFTKTHG
jgi:hypothetical protein